MSCAETAEPVMSQFGAVLWAQMWAQIPRRERALLQGTYALHLLDNGLVLSQRMPDATNTTQQGHYAAQMRPIATISLATCQLPAEGDSGLCFAQYFFYLYLFIYWLV